MTMHYGAGPRAGIGQAASAPHPAGRVASALALPVRRPASETAAALPADPFARRPRLRGRGSRRLSGRSAVFVLASLIVALLASSAAPTPLYAVYQAQWHFPPLTPTPVFGAYPMAGLPASAARRETVSGARGGLAGLGREITLPGALRARVLTAVPVLFAVWALAGLYGALGPALVHALTGSGDVVLGSLSLFVLAASAVVAIIVLRRTAARTVMLVGILALITGVARAVLARPL